MDAKYLIEFITCPFCMIVCLKMHIMEDGIGGHEGCVREFMKLVEPRSVMTNLPLAHRMWVPSKSNDMFVRYFLKNTDVFDGILNEIVSVESLEGLMMIVESGKINIVDLNIICERLKVILKDRGCEGNEGRMLKKILDGIIDLEKRNRIIDSLFWVVWKSGRQDIIVEFLDKTPLNFVDKDASLLIYACGDNFENICMKILDHPSANINYVDENGNNALILACDRGLEKVCMKMLDFDDIWVNYIDDDGDNALILACDMGLERVCLKILDFDDIQVNHINNYGDNAFMSACRVGSEEVCMKILDNLDFQINFVDKEGFNGLLTACYYGLEKVCMSILDRSDVMINYTNKYGNNALHVACNKKLEKVCMRILDYPDLRIDHRDNNNKSALDFAKNSKMTKVCEKISRRMKKRKINAS